MIPKVPLITHLYSPPPNCMIYSCAASCLWALHDALADWPFTTSPLYVRNEGLGAVWALYAVKRHFVFGTSSTRNWIYNHSMLILGEMLYVAHLAGTQDIRALRCVRWTRLSRSPTNPRPAVSRWPELQSEVLSNAKRSNGTFGTILVLWASA